jgi:condensin complex subunit 2
MILFKISEGVNTLEANLENISIKQFDMGFDVDPLFKKTSAAFDEGDYFL